MCKGEVEPSFFTKVKILSTSSGLIKLICFGGLQNFYVIQNCIGPPIIESGMHCYRSTKNWKWYILYLKVSDETKIIVYILAYIREFIKYTVYKVHS